MSAATPAADGELRRIGAQLAKLRKTRGYSQNRLAAVSGVSQGTISNIEAGGSFEMGNLLVLLAILDRQLGDFFVDAGFTAENEAYNEYVFTITMLGKRIKRVSGIVSGPGIQRATK